MNSIRLGFALCGSFCTFGQTFPALVRAKDHFGDVTPILSDSAAVTDTRFGQAADFAAELERVCGRPVIDSIKKAEPIGPRQLLDALVVAPCTGNTLAKLACSIADTSVTMACKSHLRNGRPLILAVSTNDGLAGAAKNIGLLLDKKHIYFVPFRQDDPVKKPASLVADFTLINEAVEAALAGRQLQPLLLGP